MKQGAAYVRNMPGEKYQITGFIVRETNDATLFHVLVTEEEHWLPNSQIDSKHRERATTGYDRLIITAWIAKKKGIIS